MNTFKKLNSRGKIERFETMACLLIGGASDLTGSGRERYRIFRQHLKLKSYFVIYGDLRQNFEIVRTLD